MIRILGIARNLSCELLTELGMIWFSDNVWKSGDEQISVKETCELYEERAAQHLLQHCFQEPHDVALQRTRTLVGELAVFLVFRCILRAVVELSLLSNRELHVI